MWARAHDRRRRDTTSGRVLESCDLIAAELAAGRPTSAVLAEAASAWPELVSVVEAEALGLDVPAAMREIARVPGARGLALLAAGWEIALRTGHGLGDTTAAVAGDLRAASAMRRTIDSELASARATAWLVAGLPFLALGLGTATGGDPWSFLLGTSAGLACLTGGFGFGLLGLWWIDAIAARAGA